MKFYLNLLKEVINYSKNFLDSFISQKKCKNNTEIKNDAIRVCNLYLSDEYISLKRKKRNLFIFNRTQQK